MQGTARRLVSWNRMSEHVRSKVQGGQGQILQSLLGMRKSLASSLCVMRSSVNVC